MKHVSCIILNYNDYSTTMTLVDEIKDYMALKSIVVVDNNSTDQSYEELKQLEDEKISVLKTNTNGGYGFGNNIGIRFAYSELKADYVLIANPDVHFSNDTVEAMVDMLESNSSIGICAPTALKPSGENQTLIAWRLQRLWDYALSSSMIYLKYFSKKYYKQNHFKYYKWAEVDVVPGSLLMINADYMIKYGMYDEENFLYSEEEMLAIKFKKQNLKTILLLNESYIHEHSVSISKSFPSEINKKKMNLNSRMFVLDKYYQAKPFQKRLIKLIGKIALFENKFIFKIKGFK